MKSILIVEDDIAIRDVLEMVLKEETTSQVFVASNGIEAICILQTATPDLFLLDYCLPGMNGVQLIDRIRDMGIFNHTPIILISACLYWENPGVQDVRFLRKPFELDVFLRVVEEELHRR